MATGYKYNDGGRSKYYPTSKKSNNTTDCVIRSIAIALEKDYQDVMRSLYELSIETGYMYNHDKCYEKYLEKNGWKKQKTIKDFNGKKYRLTDLPNPFNITMIIHTVNHLTVIKDGDVNDTWDCRDWCANSYFIKTEN